MDLKILFFQPNLHLYLHSFGFAVVRIWLAQNGHLVFSRLQEFCKMSCLTTSERLIS